MISLQTEEKLAYYLFELARGEEKVELSRQCLAVHASFNLEELFLLIDRSSISTSSLCSFLTENNIQSTESEVELLIKQYDADGDSELSLEEFSHLVYPSTSEPIRNLAVSGPKRAPSRYTIDLLKNLIGKELLLQRILLRIQEDMKARYDFNLNEMFKRIDTLNTGFIDKTSLRVFLDRHGYGLVEMEIKSILRRVDGDCDDQISLREFLEMFDTRNYVCKSVQSPVKQSVSTENRELILFLLEKVKIHRKINSFRYKLLEQFSVLEAYKIFDSKNIGYITLVNFEETLKQLNILHTKQNVNLLVRRYCCLQDGKIRFSDFKEMVTNDLPFQDNHSAANLNLFTEFLKILLKSEEELENSRFFTLKSQKFSSFKAFQTLDIFKKGFIGIEELDYALEGIEINIEDLQDLLKAFDKNRDGKISYAEFIQEISPRFNYK